MMTTIREGYKETEIGVIPEDWEVDTLNNLCVKIFVGIATSTTEYFTDSGIPLIRNQNIKEGKLDFLDIKYITQEFAKANKSKTLMSGDILTVRTGYPGISCVVPKEFEGSQTFTTLITRPKANRINSYYLSYFINSGVGKKILESLKAGGAQQNLNVKSFEKLNVVFPPLHEQQRIAEILTTTDAHIEKLDKIIEDYQLLKKGMMKKLLTEGIGHTEFKETEIGRIPKEWEVKRVSECFTIITTSIKPYEYEGKKFTHYSIPAFDTNQNPIVEFGKTIKSNKYKVSSNTILVSKLNPRTLRVWNIKEASEDSICSTEFINFHKICDGDHDYFFHVFNSEIFQKELLNLEAGSTGSRKRVTPTDTYSIQLPLPSLIEQISIGKFMTDITNRIKLLEDERIDFIELKKSLMEKLLTGKVRVI